MEKAQSSSAKETKVVSMAHRPSSGRTVRILIVEEGEVILKKDFSDFPVKFVKS